MTQTQATAEAGAASAAGTNTDRVLTITRQFAAPIEAVYRAWTDPKQLAVWWGPESVTTPHCETDLREGGRWRTCMRMPDGSEMWVGGVYREVAPPDRLAFTWAWDQEDGSRGHETVVEIELTANDGGTELRLTQSLFQDSEACKLHNEGWTSSFVCLDTHIAEG